MKNKELLDLMQEKKGQISCDNCRYCNINAYHNGKWYCSNPNVSIFDIPVEIEKCFVRKGCRE